MAVTLQFIGGADSVTGSKYLVRSGAQSLLFDCVQGRFGLVGPGAQPPEHLAPLKPTVPAPSSAGGA